MPFRTVTRKRPWSIADLPDWFSELQGYDMISPQLRDSGPGPERTWQVSMAFPADIEVAARRVDPLVILVALAYGAARIEEKMGEVVNECRRSGRSWTQIGQALGISKQAAWERFAGEGATNG